MTRRYKKLSDNDLPTMHDECLKVEALEKVAEWVISCDSKEYDDYLIYCKDLGINPKNITGKNQIFHPYALALIGLGLKFPKE